MVHMIIGGLKEQQLERTTASKLYLLQTKIIYLFIMVFVCLHFKNVQHSYSKWNHGKKKKKTNTQ